jgi:tripartite-type tricarboxylate transporter receptor subunit TctC
LPVTRHFRWKTRQSAVFGVKVTILERRIMLGLLRSLIFVSILGCAFAASAQVYPSRPITAVVGYPAGGPTDTLARILTEPMKAFLGQPVIIENVTGAAGSIGAGRVARAVPDGYTIIVGDVSTHVFNGAIYPLSYDLVKDFQPVSLLPSSPSLILSRNSLPVKNLAELITWLKVNQNKAVIGTAGVGSPGHVSSVRLQLAIGTNAQLVPYRGAAPMMQALVAGEVDVGFNQVSNALPLVRAGKVRAYAVTTKTRSAAAPEIPTVDEAGLADFYASTWRGIWAPRGTPREVIVKLNAAVLHALSDEALRKRLTELGEDIPLRNQQTPEALGAFQNAEIEKWWPIIKAAGIKPE